MSNSDLLTEAQMLILKAKLNKAEKAVDDLTAANEELTNQVNTLSKTCLRLSTALATRNNDGCKHNKERGCSCHEA